MDKQLVRLLQDMNIVVAAMEEQLELIEQNVRQLESDVARYKAGLQHKHRAAE